MMSDTIISLPEFSEAGKSVSGELPLSGMLRLQKVLAAAATGALSYTLRGERDSGGRLFLLLDFSASLPSFCQRCMQQFNLPLSSNCRFVLSDDDKDIPDDCEPLETKDLHLAEFLEDEVLLSLPLTPLHDLRDCPAQKHMAG